MRRKMRRGPAVVSLALTMALGLPSCWAGVTVATVGDSFADSVYLGLRSQPKLLKQHNITLVRWSRPIIGLVRTDYFDYATWLRETNNLGKVDLCIAQVGANDVQAIPLSKGKWVRLLSDPWNTLYTERVQAVEETLTTRRCRQTIWILQPGYQKNAFLKRYHGQLNDLQKAALDPGRTLVFEIATEAGDYGQDGIHYSGPFCLKLAQAMIRLLDACQQFAPESCYSCHSRVDLKAKLVPSDLAPLHLVMPGRARPALTAAGGW